MASLLEVLFFVLVVSSTPGRLQADAEFPFRNTSLSWQERVEDLVARLSLEEIYPQTLATYGSFTPAIPRLGIKPYVWISECLRGLVNTNSTTFPQALGLAATFSVQALYNISMATSVEQRAHWNANSARGEYVTFMGLSCFSPMINIARHPLWGRNQETYGEDPYLSGQLAAGFVKGLQGSHKRYVRASSGCKAYDLYAGPENIPVSRLSFNAVVSMRDWRMTFLPAYKICVDAGTFNLMCSYNSINGVPACAHRQLLTDITRKEWGFTGYVVSDAGAITNIMTQHHYINNTVDTVTAAIKAGCNLELGHDELFLSQAEALEQGKLTEAEIRENVKPLMYTRMRLGEFDPPEMNPYSGIGLSVVQSAEHREIAIRAATMSYVLLKNNDKLLPFHSRLGHIAVIGPMADNAPQLFGDYSPKIYPEFTNYKTPRKALQEIAKFTNFAAGCVDVKCTEYNQTEVMSAVKSAEVIFVCLGTGLEIETEGKDRSDLSLPGKQLQLLQDAVEGATSVGSRVILLLFNSGPLDVSWAVTSNRVEAIIECFFPGQATGDALVRLLTMTGPSSNPAARLPMTWPENMGQVLDITNYEMEGRTYRYWNWTSPPLFPFGYGLSYSSFSYSDLSVSPSTIRPGQDIILHVTVHNNGPYDGEEVVQVYIAWNNVTVPVPRWQLVAFERINISLLDGAAVNVELTVTSERMAVWLDDKQGFVVPPGVITVYVGGQQPNQKINAGSNVLKGFFTVQ